MKNIFNYENSKNKRTDIHLHLKSNLYEKEIYIKKEGKIIVFNWSYSPQLTGNYKQIESYQFQCISLMVEEIISNMN